MASILIDQSGYALVPYKNGATKLLSGDLDLHLLLLDRCCLWLHACACRTWMLHMSHMCPSHVECYYGNVLSVSVPLQFHSVDVSEWRRGRECGECSSRHPHPLDYMVSGQTSI